MKFLRKFKFALNSTLQLIVLTIIMVLVAYQELSFTFSLENVIAWFALILMYIGVVYLVLNKAFFASYIIIFILYFSSAFTNFFSSFINITFDPFTFTISSDVMLYVSLLIFVYLGLMIVSYLINGGLKSRGMKGKVATLTLLFFGFYWLFIGFNAALILFPVVGVAYLFGNDRATILIIMSYLITALYSAFSGVFDTFTIGAIVLIVLEALLLAFAVKLAIPRFFPKKTKQVKQNK
jgi:hypothetical protein